MFKEQYFTGPLLLRRQQDTFSRYGITTLSIYEPRLKEQIHISYAFPISEQEVKKTLGNINRQRIAIRRLWPEVLL